MPGHMFDIETTGLDPETCKIVTAQFQKISLYTGKAEGPLEIYPIWEYTEEEIVKEIAARVLDKNQWNFVPIGNNLTFEYKFCVSKFKKYLGIDIDVGYLVSRPHLEMQSVMILANSGKFKGCHLVLGKQGNGSAVPVWYKNKEYQKIIDYIKDEAECFLNFTSEARKVLGDKFIGVQRNNDFKQNRRLDDYV